MRADKRRLFAKMGRVCRDYREQPGVAGGGLVFEPIIVAVSRAYAALFEHPDQPLDAERELARLQKLGVRRLAHGFILQPARSRFKAHKRDRKRERRDGRVLRLSRHYV